MKYTLALVAALTATTAYADEVTAYVEDQYTTVTENVPYTVRECQMVQVPQYGTVTRPGNAAGGALLGMIIGGALGDAVSDGDGGATAGGAVIGGLIGADQGSRPQQETVVTGYVTQQQCSNITRYRSQQRSVYSHSVLTFTVDGQTYETTFIR